MMSLRRFFGYFNFLILAFVGLIFSAHFILTGLTYVRLFFDDNGYHIPMAVEIARTGNPFVIAIPTYLAAWYPALAETFAALCIGIAGNIRYSNLTGSLSAIFIMLFSYRTGHLLAGNRRDALLIALAVACMPILMGQSRAFYNDIHFAACGTAAFFYLMRAFQTEDSSDLLKAIACAALTAGIKYSGLFFIATMAPFCLYGLCRFASRPTKRSIAVLLLALITGFSWFGRNILLKGNPLYPFTVPAWLQKVFQTLFGSFEHIPTLPLDAPSHNSPGTIFPHPFIPEHFLQFNFAPDIGADAYGPMFTLALVLAVMTMFYLFRHRVDRLPFSIGIMCAMAPFILLPHGVGWSIPRYSLASAVMMILLVGCFFRQSHIPQFLKYTVRSLMFFYVLAYCYHNIWFGLPSLGDMIGYQKMGAILTTTRPMAKLIRPLVAKGNLRIGYLSGSNNFIALLYDDAMTNELIALHYRDYYFHKGEQISEEQFIDSVKKMNLDYIKIFDPDRPGADLLKKNFSEKLLP